MRGQGIIDVRASPVFLALAVLLGCSALPVDALKPMFRTRARTKQTISRSQVRADLLSHCDERWRNATLDHFTWGKNQATTFPQRYFVCSTYWRPASKDAPAGPIFFYLGNEANVLLYLNHTGLMWESAPDFGALLVFAEHRYYGESLPFPKKELRQHMDFLSAEQAMADYAEIINEVKADFGIPTTPVIGFGGSYGGMLATWFRIKYPHLLDGAIAASAPIWVFFGETPEVNPYFFARGTTFDASAVGGSSAACVKNVRHAWRELLDFGGTEKGRDALRSIATLCKDVPLDSHDDVIVLRDWLSAAWDNMAMGNFPYPSSYILNGDGELPAFPVRAACQYLSEENLEGRQLLKAMVSAVGVYYNNSGTKTCYDYQSGVNQDTDEDGGFWDFQYCTEMLMPFSRDGVQDMFWDDPFDLEATKKGCQQNWGVTPDARKATIEWGGRHIGAASNIVFSNGLQDPWHGGGVLRDLSDTLRAAVIPEGAHHLDLMFSHPDDPQSVIQCRKFQREQIEMWIKEAGQEPNLRAPSTSSTSRSTDDSNIMILNSGAGVKARPEGKLIIEESRAGGVAGDKARTSTSRRVGGGWDKHATSADAAT